MSRSSTSIAFRCKSPFDSLFFTRRHVSLSNKSCSLFKRQIPINLLLKAHFTRANFNYDQAPPLHSRLNLPTTCSDFMSLHHFNPWDRKVGTLLKWQMIYLLMKESHSETQTFIYRTTRSSIANPLHCVTDFTFDYSTCQPVVTSANLRSSWC